VFKIFRWVVVVCSQFKKKDKRKEKADITTKKMYNSERERKLRTHARTTTDRYISATERKREKEERGKK